ncbi:toast rack family protein [Pontibacter sp. SGAir0037]|uniref:toast rack family protein n=1 Tax=Pontibacter sp. SGAir0037 TaxID=2571030 RepID=UPI0010CD3555|nr:toast rack family protein [Pontibacter sp. SGAir0037]QCR21263.1 hypothetical protein C1N53_02125 [Pontibacter sp. SGAir0037]
MKKPLLLLLSVLPLYLLVAQSKHSFEYTLPATGVKQNELTLEVPAGKLTLNSGTTSLVTTRIDYSLPEWKPKVTTSKNGEVSTLNIKQENFKNKSGKLENNWDVSINKNVPLSLHIALGAGDATIDLRNSSLRKLQMETGAGSCNVNLQGSKAEQIEINTGVGELDLDLSGNWNHNLAVEINGGIGSMNVKVPKGTGVSVQTSVLGSKSLNGFKKSGGVHKNSAYGKTKNTITIQISGGLGSIDVTEV